MTISWSHFVILHVSNKKETFLNFNVLDKIIAVTDETLQKFRLVRDSKA